MGLNETASANRIHIGFFGRRNAGKSSVVNAVTNQELSIVSEVMGTTTDPVTKSMELLPLGPVLIIDTPGYDDEGGLGELRVKKTKQILNKTDIAVLIVDATIGITDIERELICLFEKKDIPYIIVYNKCDLIRVSDMRHLSEDSSAILISAKNKHNIEQLKEKLAFLKPDDGDRKLVADLVKKDDIVILVTPIDSAAPKGRLIMPQQMVLRELLDVGAMAVVIKEDAVQRTLCSLSESPKLIITDSQAFDVVAASTPENITITSFSILMARYKGFLDTAVKGVRALDGLKERDKILICEGCTHHRQCDDIGTVKLPGWIEGFTKKSFDYSFTSGGDFPENPEDYKLIIHCGGCMLPEKELLYRMKCANDMNVPFTNYGTIIAYMNGILDRALKVFRI